MSRRRLFRKRTRRRLWAAAMILGALGWAWQTHPAALVLTAALAVPAGLAGWRARRAWLMRKGEETVLYRHYFSDGTPLYYGISNDYAERCGQHADGSWWWYYIADDRSTCQTFPNRRAAAMAETAAIRRDGPIGNTRDNPRWYAQRAEREALMAQASRHRVYAQPPPVLTIPSRTYDRRRRVGAQRWAVR